jgi:hypothetical protein
MPLPKTCTSVLPTFRALFVFHLACVQEFEVITGSEKQTRNIGIQVYGRMIIMIFRYCLPYSCTAFNLTLHCFRYLFVFHVYFIAYSMTNTRIYDREKIN